MTLCKRCEIMALVDRYGELCYLNSDDELSVRREIKDRLGFRQK